MYQLPHENIANIFEYCQVDDIKSLLLTCNDFSSNMKEYIYKNKKIVFHIKDLSFFEKYDSKKETLLENIKILKFTSKDVYSKFKSKITKKFKKKKVIFDNFCFEGKIKLDPVINKIVLKRCEGYIGENFFGNIKNLKVLKIYHSKFLSIEDLPKKVCNFKFIRMTPEQNFYFDENIIKKTKFKRFDIDYSIKYKILSYYDSEMLFQFLSNKFISKVFVHDIFNINGIYSCKPFIYQNFRIGKNLKKIYIKEKNFLDGVFLNIIKMGIEKRKKRLDLFLIKGFKYCEFIKKHNGRICYPNLLNISKKVKVMCDKNDDFYKEFVHGKPNKTRFIFKKSNFIYPKY